MNALPRPIRTVLVANRGEIARRVFRTARAMGMATVAVYSDPDRRAPHVRDADVAVPLGGSSADESYLQIDKLVDAANRAGADAVHPGYGFLAENADFAGACSEAGLVWIGPPAAAIAAMARKVEAKELMAASGVPVLPSALAEGDEPNAWLAAADRVGYPLLVKASAGGGGKGMRAVHDPAALVEAVRAGRREAESSFGDPTVFLERLLVRPRHVEVQVFGDEHGNVLHLFERDCSLQRRHQKVVEEARAPGLSDALTGELHDAATRAARAVGYVNAGTVEFLVEGEECFFLEMNTRLQVEHPVTEEVCGLDLVRLQLEVAQGGVLPVEQSQVASSGHAIEVRLYAEDPRRDFLPSVGELVRFEIPDVAGVRWDSGVETGSVVSPFYDPMLAKVVAHAPTRREAAARLEHGLRGLQVHGVETNRDMLVASLASDDFLAGRVHTGFFDDHPEVLTAEVPDHVRTMHAVGASLVLRRRRVQQSPFGALGAVAGWRNVASSESADVFDVATAEGDVAVRVALGPAGARSVAAAIAVDGVDRECSIVTVDECDAEIELHGLRHRVSVHSDGARHWVNGGGWQTELRERPRFASHDADAARRGPTAPVPGTVVVVEVEPGQHFAAGEVLLVIEAMKMEHRILADADCVVAAVLVHAGDRVDAHQLLVELEAADE